MIIEPLIFIATALSIMVCLKFTDEEIYEKYFFVCFLIQVGCMMTILFSGAYLVTEYVYV
jgi:hypothetical protein